MAGEVSEDMKIRLNQLCGQYVVSKSTCAMVRDSSEHLRLNVIRREIQKLIPANYHHRWACRDFFVDRSGALQVVPLESSRKD